MGTSSLTRLGPGFAVQEPLDTELTLNVVAPATDHAKRHPRNGPSDPVANLTLAFYWTAVGSLAGMWSAPSTDCVVDGGRTLIEALSGNHS